MIYRFKEIVRKLASHTDRMLNADPLGLFSGLPHEIDRGADIKDVVQPLVDETLSNQEAHDRLACACVQ
jgi:hypothetical protein